MLSLISISSNSSHKEIEMWNAQHRDCQKQTELTSWCVPVLEEQAL